MKKQNKYYELKKVHIFDKYSTWNLVYSLMAIIMNLLFILYYTLYDASQTFLQFGTVWFWLFFGLIIIFTLVFLVVNVYYSTFKLIKSIKYQKIKHIVFYSIGIIIPFVGVIFHQIDRKRLIYISDNLLEEVKL